ncbi:MAG: DUF308 domain-containing protein [Clostridium sp.]
MKFLEKIFIIEGFLFLLLGVLFFWNPVNSLITLTKVTGLILISLGILYLMSEDRNITMSVIDIILGVGLIAMPGESINLIISFYGAWSVVRGIFILIESFQGGWADNKFSIIYSILITVLGLLILINPIISFFSVPYVIGTYFIVSGVCELYIGFMIK